MNQEKLYSTKEVADIFKVHPDTILRWIKEGKITQFKKHSERTYRFTQETIDELVKEGSGK